MASKSIDGSSTARSQLLHFTVVGALVFAIVFIACWLFAFTPVSATHAFIALFTTAETTSLAALVQGTCWSLVFGAWAGFVTAAAHRIATRIGF